LHAQSVYVVDKLKSAEMSLRQEVESNSTLLAKLESEAIEVRLGATVPGLDSAALSKKILAVKNTLAQSKAKHEKFMFSLSIEEKIERHH
jgi:hypothetical protein